MKTLLVVATLLEIKPLLERAQKKTFSNSLYTYCINGKEVDVVCTGVGMVATAFHLATVLATNKYQFVINAGIAGSFDKSLPLGAVVEVVEDQFSEMGADDNGNFMSLIDLNLMSSNEFPYQAGLLNNKQSGISLSYPKVKGITVNTVHGSEQTIQKTIIRCSPQVESMEGAAFFYACKSAKTPCLQIRSISNYVERRNRASWNIPLAVNNLNTELLKLL